MQEELEGQAAARSTRWLLAAFVLLVVLIGIAMAGGLWLGKL